uniref:Uncharacterized protein n=1 Tax=Knipowitschia caucasica TaxID=637954 RepID=A0AAV2K9T2_KNICA
MRLPPSDIQSGCHLSGGRDYEVPVKCGCGGGCGGGSAPTAGRGLYKPSPANTPEDSTSSRIESPPPPPRPLPPASLPAHSCPSASARGQIVLSPHPQTLSSEDPLDSYSLPAQSQPPQDEDPQPRDFRRYSPPTAQSFCRPTEISQPRFSPSRSIQPRPSQNRSSPPPLMQPAETPGLVPSHPSARAVRSPTEIPPAVPLTITQIPRYRDRPAHPPPTAATAPPPPDPPLASHASRVSKPRLPPAPPHPSLVNRPGANQSRSVYLPQPPIQSFQAVARSPALPATSDQHLPDYSSSHFPLRHMPRLRCAQRLVSCSSRPDTPDIRASAKAEADRVSHLACRVDPQIASCPQDPHPPPAEGKARPRNTPPHPSLSGSQSPPALTSPHPPPTRFLPSPQIQIRAPPQSSPALRYSYALLPRQSQGPQTPRAHLSLDIQQAIPYQDPLPDTPPTPQAHQRPARLRPRHRHCRLAAAATKHRRRLDRTRSALQIAIARSASALHPPPPHVWSTVSRRSAAAPPAADSPPSLLRSPPPASAHRDYILSDRSPRRPSDNWAPAGRYPYQNTLPAPRTSQITSLPRPAPAARRLPCSPASPLHEWLPRTQPPRPSETQTPLSVNSPSCTSHRKRPASRPPPGRYLPALPDRTLADSTPSTPIHIHPSDPSVERKFLPQRSRYHHRNTSTHSPDKRSDSPPPAKVPQLPQLQSVQELKTVTDIHPPD